MKIHIEESNHTQEFNVEAIQDMDISCGDLVSYEYEKLTNFDVASEIKQQENMLGGDDSCYALAINKVLDTSVNFEATQKFELLANSTYKNLILYVEANYVQIPEVTQVDVYKYGQSFAFDFTCVQVIANTHSYCNRQLDVCWDKLDA